MQFLQKESWNYQRDGRSNRCLGPGFVAGEDVDYVVETMRGHNLARIITKALLCQTQEFRVSLEDLEKSACSMLLQREIHCISKIADIVEKDQSLPGSEIHLSGFSYRCFAWHDQRWIYSAEGMKIADIDPRKEQKKNCFTISDKARCIAGSVLEILLSEGVMPYEAPGRFSGTAAD